jgi:hypothetical protein
MATTHFSGPVQSTTGFTSGTTTTALLPTASDHSGRIMVVSDNGTGDNEFALVVSNGTAWVKITTTALT